MDKVIKILVKGTKRNKKEPEKESDIAIECQCPRDKGRLFRERGK